MPYLDDGIVYNPDGAGLTEGVIMTAYGGFKILPAIAECRSVPNRTG